MGTYVSRRLPPAAEATQPSSRLAPDRASYRAGSCADGAAGVPRGKRTTLVFWCTLVYSGDHAAFAWEVLDPAWRAMPRICCCVLGGSAGRGHGGGWQG